MNRWSKRWKAIREQRAEGRRIAKARSFASGINAIPKLITSDKRGAATLALPSGPIVGGVCARQSMTDPVVLRSESPEIRAAILAKASRLAPLYNKGPVQYVTEDQHPSRGKRNA